jgi:hypothetical protein
MLEAEKKLLAFKLVSVDIGASLEQGTVGVHMKNSLLQLCALRWCL